jgi:hypothetical protein
VEEKIEPEHHLLPVLQVSAPGSCQIFVFRHNHILKIQASNDFHMFFTEDQSCLDIPLHVSFLTWVPHINLVLLTD